MKYLGLGIILTVAGNILSGVAVLLYKNQAAAFLQFKYTNLVFAGGGVLSLVGAAICLAVWSMHKKQK